MGKKIISNLEDYLKEKLSYKEFFFYNVNLVRN